MPTAMARKSSRVPAGKSMPESTLKPLVSQPPPPSRNAHRGRGRHHALGLCGLVLLALLGGIFPAAPARAQNTGFQLNRYEPTTVGEWSFMVDHPWYSATRYFAAGLTLNYGHNSLVLGRLSSKGSFSQIDPIILHQFLGHFEVAGSFLDRVNLSFMLPVTFLERGQEAGGVTPLPGAGVGDPRFAGMVRLLGQADRTPFSLHLSATVWIPLRQFNASLAPQLSEQTVRFAPKLIAGGLYRKFRWSATASFLYRAEALLGQTVTVGPEVQIGLSGSYADLYRRFAVGPEILLSTVVTGGNAFGRDFTSLETLLGAHYNAIHQLQFGAAVGLGILRQPGTPDVRFLVRMAYAPIRRPPDADLDRDGIPDRDDACPQEKGISDPDRARNGCPRPSDVDNDGVSDSQDLCPREPRGLNPDPKRVGCPMGDQDRDGILDVEDACPKQPPGDKPDPSRKGCPMPDRDSDGVIDKEDACPDEVAGDKPDPKRPGCPMPKPKEPAVDEEFLRGLRPIFFARRSSKLDRRNEEGLQALAEQLRKHPERKKILIRGHSDREGSEADNDRLSRERAEAVRAWLIRNGIAADRLETRGLGRSTPIPQEEGKEDQADSPAARARNRRTDFRPSDPVLAEADLRRLEALEQTSQPSVEEEPAERPRRRGKRSRLDVLLDEVEQQQRGGEAPPAGAPANP
jgi:OOP family OmpA-OmpF porin